MALSPDEQDGVQLLLKGSDLVAQRRLADVELLSRPCDVELLCDGDKVFQYPEFHDALLFYHMKKI